MSKKKRFLRLESLVAYLQTESDGDEIFFKYKGEKVAPAGEKYIRMQAGPVTLDAEIELEDGDNWIELELWDYDHFSPNDCLGKFRFLGDEIGETFSSELMRDDNSEARYVLYWSLIQRTEP